MPQTNIGYDVTLLLIGAGISLFSALLTFTLTNLFQRIGGFRVFGKIVYSKVDGRKACGFYKIGSPEPVFQVPLWLEFKNTSNVPRIVQNVSLCLFKDRKMVAEMIQISHLVKNEGKPDQAVIQYASQGAYSFTLPPTSITKYDLQFVIRPDDIPSSDKTFSEVVLRCLVDNGVPRYFPLCTVKNCWAEGTLIKDTSWRFLERSCKYMTPRSKQGVVL